MFNVTIAAKTPDDLKASIFDMAKSMGFDAAPAKKITDFSLQDIVEYLKGMGFIVNAAEEEAPSEPKPLHELIAEDEAKKTAKPPKSIKKVKVAEPDAPASEVVSETGDPADLKDKALKRIMASYTTPAGKAAASALLKEFGVKNFHLIPEDLWVELHEKTMAAFDAAGLA